MLGFIKPNNRSKLDDENYSYSRKKWDTLTIQEKIQKTCQAFVKRSQQKLTADLPEGRTSFIGHHIPGDKEITTSFLLHPRTIF